MVVCAAAGVQRVECSPHDLKIECPDLADRVVKLLDNFYAATSTVGPGHLLSSTHEGASAEVIAKAPASRFSRVRSVGPAVSGTIGAPDNARLHASGTLIRMATQAPAADAPPVPEGLSAFVAKILDQLSLSAWLPAALLSATLTLLLQFRRQHSADLHAALIEIGDRWVVVLLLAVPVLVLTTLTTQAFSFSAIRTLEGYSMRRIPMRWVRWLLTRLQVRRWERLRRQRRLRSGRAFDNSESRWATEPAEIVMALRAQAQELKPLEPTDVDQRNRLSKLDWRVACDPWDLSRFEDARAAVNEYPSRSRIMPTRLGNVLRSTEDAVVNDTGEDLETFAMRRRSWLAPRTQFQHDQFRTRLDMYCTLVFVSTGLAAVTLALTIGEPKLLAPFALICAGLILLALVAYYAAVASARGYCTILRLMKDARPPGDGAALAPTR